MHKQKLLIQGWRGLAHSYAVVNQFQCLQLLQNPKLKLFFEDLPLLGGWQPDPTLLNADDMRQINAIGAMGQEAPDVVYRIGFPFDFESRHACRHLIFVTTEYGTLRPDTCVQKLGANVQIITPSQWSKEGLINSGLAANKIHVVPHGIDPKIYYPYEIAEREQLRAASGIAPDDLVLLNVSTMTGNKGIDVLLKAFATLLPQYPKLRLLLKGNDALYTSKKILGERLAALSASEQALVLPRISYFGDNLSFARMAQFYQLADCLVSPYYAEAFNLPVLEAAACGVPIICTAGGPTDDFTHDTFALKIKSEKIPEPSDASLTILKPNLEHLSQLIVKVIGDVQWRQTAQIRAADYVKEKFSWATVTEKLTNIIVP